MIRRFSRLPVVGAIAAAASLVAACASGGGSATATGVEKPDLTVATVPTLDNAGLYVAQQRGLFAAEGLHVTLASATSGSVMFAAQLAGKYDITVGAYVSSMLADALHHADLRVIAPASAVAPLSQEVVVPPGSPIQTVGDLNGKKIGLNGLTGIGIVMVSALLSDNGVPLNKVHFVVIPYPKMAAALAAHKVDAVQIPEPYLTGAEESVGAVAIADVDQGPAQSLPVSGYTATQSWLDKYPRTAAAFRRAVLKAQVIANTNLAAVQDAIATYGGTSLATARLAAPPAFPLQTNARLLQRVADLLEQFGLTQQVFNASSMIRG
jgi:NitT/TauT family transport system substrate-binding protein